MMVRMTIRAAKRSKPRSRWDRMVEVEPRLADVAKAAAGAFDKGRTSWADWNEITKELRKLTGWWGDNPRLRSQKTYDEASEHLLALFETGVPPKLRRSSAPWPPAEARLPGPIVLESLGQPESSM